MPTTTVLLVWRANALPKCVVEGATSPPWAESVALSGGVNLLAASCDSPQVALAESEQCQQNLFLGVALGCHHPAHKARALKCSARGV